MSGTGTVVIGAARASEPDTFTRALIEGAGLLVAVDGGLSACLGAGRVPDVCIGDFDSAPVIAVERAENDGCRMIRHPAEKDASDLDLALDLARAEGWSGLTLTGILAGRLDHTLASLGAVARNADLGIVVREPDVDVHPLAQHGPSAVALSTRPGEILSIFAIGGEATVTASGVRYPLSAHPLSPCTSLGLSNVAVAPVQHISVQSGRVLIIVPRAESR